MRPQKLALTAALILLAAAGAGSKPAAAAPDSRQRQNASASSQTTASARAVLAYLLNPGPTALKTALETCLAAREKISDDAFNDFLIAFCRREMGDAAGEARALLPYSPEKRDTYRFIFDAHRGALADGLYFLTEPCERHRERHDPDKPRPVKCRDGAEGGPAGAAPVKKEDSLRTILDQVGNGLLDNKLRLEPEMTAGGPAEFLARIGVKKDQTLADIGCGIGYLTFPAAATVGAAGKVYAEDIDPIQIELIRSIVAKEGAGNVAPILGSETDMGIPPGVLDTALIVNVYRNILRDQKDQAPKEREAFWDAFFANVRKALKPDGVLVIADRLDSHRVFTVDKTVAALKKRGFAFIADKSAEPGRAALLLFKK